MSSSDAIPRMLAEMAAHSSAPSDSHQSSSDQARGAWRSPRAWAIFLGTLAIGTAVDIASKYFAFNHVSDDPVVFTREDVLAVTPELYRLIPQHEPVRAIPGLLDFTLVLNPGAVFGVGAGQRAFFIAATLVALVFGVTIFCASTRRRDWFAHACLGLLLAGGVGNLYDRVIYACVRDFIHPLPQVRLPWGWSWPWGGRDVWPYVSNIADLFLLIGIGGLLVHAWRADARHRSRAASNEMSTLSP